MLTATAIASPDEHDLDEMLTRHGIRPGYRSAYAKLIETGEIESAEFRLRLNTCKNYQECADEVLQGFPDPRFYRENPRRVP